MRVVVVPNWGLSVIAQLRATTNDISSSCRSSGSSAVFPRIVRDSQPYKTSDDVRKSISGKCFRGALPSLGKRACSAEVQPLPFLNPVTNSRLYLG